MRKVAAIAAAVLCLVGMAVLGISGLPGLFILALALAIAVVLVVRA